MTPAASTASAATAAAVVGGVFSASAAATLLAGCVHVVEQQSGTLASFSETFIFVDAYLLIIESILYLLKFGYRTGFVV